MSTQYGLRKSIKADELFDGRLEAFGVREGVRPEGAADRFPPYMKVREVRCLTDGSDSMEVVVWQNGYAHLDVRNLWCAPGKEIFHTIAEAFDTDIVTERSAWQVLGLRYARGVGRRQQADSRGGRTEVSRRVAEASARRAEQHPAGNHRDEERRNRKSPRRERPLAHGAGESRQAHGRNRRDL